MPVFNEQAEKPEHQAPDELNGDSFTASQSGGACGIIPPEIDEALSLVEAELAKAVGAQPAGNNTPVSFTHPASAPSGLYDRERLRVESDRSAHRNSAVLRKEEGDSAGVPRGTSEVIQLGGTVFDGGDSAVGQAIAEIEKGVSKLRTLLERSPTQSLFL